MLVLRQAYRLGDATRGMLGWLGKILLGLLTNFKLGLGLGMPVGTRVLVLGLGFCSLGGY